MTLTKSQLAEWKAFYALARSAVPLLIAEVEAHQRDPYYEDIVAIKADRDSLRAQLERTQRDLRSWEASDFERQLDEARSSAARWAPVIEAAKELAPTLEGTGDWACEVCRPNSDLLHINPGFRCRPHALRAAIDPALAAKETK